LEPWSLCIHRRLSLNFYKDLETETTYYPCLSITCISSPLVRVGHKSVGALNHSSIFEKESVFKGLFASLQKIIDIEEEDLEGPDFDRQAGWSLIRHASKYIQRWRLLNNRFKHSTRNTKDFETLEKEETITFSYRIKWWQTIIL
jgi:hypothetical protein